WVSPSCRRVPASTRTPKAWTISSTLLSREYSISWASSSTYCPAGGRDHGGATGYPYHLLSPLQLADALGVDGSGVARDLCRRAGRGGVVSVTGQRCVHDRVRRRAAVGAPPRRRLPGCQGIEA